jgi:IPT/TIG domain/PQQ-like domain/Abnormal spindle-like microcephaly-assoc'd, ASPM-SPD-2-Hydin
MQSRHLMPVALAPVANACFFFLLAAAAAAQPTITRLSNTTASRSSRVLIEGSGFGITQGSGHVEIGGIAAPLTRWTDTLIAAYVPETAATGTVNVQVFTSGGSSNTVPLNVTLRSGQVGHIRWRFQADGDYIPNRPAVGGDGTVYAQDVYGHLYAVDPTGGLKWIFNASGYAFGNVSVGQEGTIYVGSAPSIFALAPDGTLKWQFNQNPAALILLGPNVGPDGNIYAVGTQGMGVFSLTPQGSLRWSVPENYDRPPVTMQEIVFGPAAQSRLYFHANNHLRGIGLNGAPLFTYADGLDTLQGDPQPAVGPDGSVYTNLQSGNLGKFDNNGNLLWHILDQSNVMSTPDVGPDGRIYDGQNLINLYAINSNGTVQWQYTDSGILFGPVVSPLNDLLLIGGRVDYGQPGFFEAVSTAGASLWKEVLPVENGLNIVPMSRARFTPDGQTAYIGTSIAGQASNGYSYLYSVQTGDGGGVPAVTLSTTKLSFTKTVIGVTSKPKSVKLTNTGTATLNISSITASGDFAISNNTCGATVSVGASCSVSVTFTPTNKGTRTGNLAFNDDAPNTPQIVALVGTGTAIKLTPSSLDFGTVTVGQKSASQTVTVTNVSTFLVTFTSFSFGGTAPGDYLITNNTCGASLSGGASCAVSMAFKPTVQGTRNAIFKVADNGGGSPQTSKLAGVGG